MSTLTKYFWLLALLAISCKPSKEVKPIVVEDLSTTKLMDHLVRNQVRAEWLEAKAKIGYDGEDMRVSASASIVMRKDSLIWMSIKKLGFEVARAQIDVDSVYLINRLTNEYTIKDLNYLASTYNLPANLKTIQAIFLGNPVFLNTKSMQLNQEEEKHHLVSSSGQLENHFWLDMTNLSLLRARYDDLRNQREVDLTLSDYQPLDAEQNFSYLRQIRVSSSELGKAAIEIDFSDVKINNPKAVRFTIPPRYTRVD